MLFTKGKWTFFTFFSLWKHFTSHPRNFEEASWLRRKYFQRKKKTHVKLPFGKGTFGTAMTWMIESFIDVRLEAFILIMNFWPLDSLTILIQLSKTWTDSRWFFCSSYFKADFAGKALLHLYSFNSLLTLQPWSKTDNLPRNCVVVCVFDTWSRAAILTSPSTSPLTYLSPNSALLVALYSATTSPLVAVSFHCWADSWLRQLWSLRKPPWHFSPYFWKCFYKIGWVKMF